MRHLKLKEKSKTVFRISIFLTSLVFSLLTSDFSLNATFFLIFPIFLLVFEFAGRKLTVFRYFSSREFITLHWTGLLIITASEIIAKLNPLNLPDKSFYYLLFSGSLLGVLGKVFLRKKIAEFNLSLLLTSVAVFLVSKNPFIGIGFLLANLVASDIYSQKRETLSEIYALLAGNAVFSFLLAGHLLNKNPSSVWLVAVFYPLAVVLQIFILFGLQKLLDLLPFMYSDEKLEKLANLSNPLIGEMMLRAPGTYHHSIMVSLLAESLAKQIGADHLLVRIGAMFHDIGKLINPQYFIENVNSENPHKNLTPEVSASIIKNHVKEGLALAKKYNLPEEIARFIPEHQGTKLIKYFYYKALRENGKADINKFRYKGPIPQSKETALVMIADTVEAMVRALKHPTPEEIRETIRKAINTLIEEGQLSRSTLTEEELKKIAKTLEEQILSYYHERIRYPEKPKKIEQK
jgi:putative nucleotidyltransferase with HDIG domain